MGDLVVVFAGNELDAELVRGKLEAYGIKAVTQDANIGSLVPNIGIGGVKVLVRGEDEEEALALLEDDGDPVDDD